jgi:hypothetical protein
LEYGKIAYQWKESIIVPQYISYFKKTFDSVRREVLYSILIEFGVPLKLLRLIEMCLNEMYSKVHVGKYLPDSGGIIPHINGNPT